MSGRRARRLPLEALAPYLVEVPPLTSLTQPGAISEPALTPLDWAAVFGNNRPVEIEVGFGKGLFLLTSALSHSEVNYLGIEVERKYQLFTATRLAKRNLLNVRLVRADAREFLRCYVATESCAAVHVYFPDPWWKKRHHKRRVFTADFAAHCERILRPGGRLNVSTDVEEYFGIISELLAQQPFLTRMSAAEPSSEAEYLTNFDRKSRQAGRPIYSLSCEKVGSVWTSPLP